MNVEHHTDISDNPEDRSLESDRIVMHLTGEEMKNLNEIRGGRTVVEYVRECMGVTGVPEHVAQAERDQQVPFDAQSALSAADVVS